jgi:hypothetical protein
MAYWIFFRPDYAIDLVLPATKPSTFQDFNLPSYEPGGKRFRAGEVHILPAGFGEADLGLYTRPLSLQGHNCAAL